LVVSKYEYDNIGRLQTNKFRPVGTTQGSKQTGNWTDASSWLSGVFPLANDNVTINTGHILTIPSGQIASAGVLNDRGTLRNFGTLNMGKVPSSDLYVETMKHHIRGGLRGINLDASDNLTNSLFSFKLEYEGNNGYFDGNIRNQYWKSSIDGVQRAYEYNYDKASRLISASYGSTKAGENYALNSVSYDLNGNITTLSRNGYKSNNTFGLVDNLGYAYQTNSNKIQSVSDNSGEIASFTDATGATDYTYSLDGSLTSDANKGISLIEYNYLKLPKRIVKGSTVILNQYDATGRKIKEIIGSNTTDYVGNKIYKNGVLYQISHDEGRIIDGDYEYFINDHLGNLRVAFRDSLGVAKITQHNAYGCWGENLPTLSYLKAFWKEDKFRQTGKEFLDETGYTDFGARLYDNLVPRFIQIDPLSELSRRFSPFTYANNNPLRFIDPDGMATQGVGADGLTNDQWLSAGGDFGREKEYRQENADKDKDKNKKKEESKTNKGTRLLGTTSSGNTNTGTAIASATLTWISADVMLPEPTDLAPPKWVAYGIAGAAAGAYLYSSGILEKLKSETEGILKRTLGGNGFVYVLVTATSGSYNVYTRGSATPTGQVLMGAGEIWKIGETTSKERYDPAYLLKEKVLQVPVFYGNQVEIKLKEKFLLYGYFFNSGNLPPGNKIFR
jgi:RHS repeat-associated protein